MLYQELPSISGLALVFPAKFGTIIGVSATAALLTIRVPRLYRGSSGPDFFPTSHSTQNLVEVVDK